MFKPHIVTYGTQKTGQMFTTSMLMAHYNEPITEQNFK